MLIKNLKIKKKRKIVGRGISAGQGKSCGRGQKGQGARKSSGPRIGFEGGQTPVFRRIPKHGQSKDFALKTRISIINLESLERDEKIKNGDVVDLRKKKKKILGKGLLTKKITIKAHGFSSSAKEKIKEAGGEFEIIKKEKIKKGKINCFYANGQKQK